MSTLADWAGSAALLALTAAFAAWIASREVGSAQRIVRGLAYLAPALVLTLLFPLAPRLAVLSLGAVVILCCAIAEVDARKQIIPDVLVAVLAGLAVVSPITPDWSGKLVGAIVLGAVFVGARQAYFAWRREEGLGLGDVKFAAMMGALLGAQVGLLAVAAAATGTIAWLLVMRRSAVLAGPTVAHAARIAPFGVGLAAALACGAALKLGGVL